MCLAVPYKIISIEGNKAKADLFGAEKEIDIRIVDNIDKNDYVLVHAGFAIQKVDEKEANETLELLRELSENK